MMREGVISRYAAHTFKRSSAGSNRNGWKVFRGLAAAAVSGSSLLLHVLPKAKKGVVAEGGMWLKLKQH